MRLRRVEEVEAYWTPEGDVVLARPLVDEQGNPRRDPDGRSMWHGRSETMLEMIRGKRLSEQKAIVKQHRKTRAFRWVDKEGKTQGWSYTPDVVEMRIEIPDAHERMAEYMRRLKDINTRLAAARQRLQSPDVTQADRDEFLALQAEALELQTEYLRFREMVED